MAWLFAESATRFLRHGLACKHRGCHASAFQAYSLLTGGSTLLLYSYAKRQAQASAALRITHDCPGVQLRDKRHRPLRQPRLPCSSPMDLLSRQHVVLRFHSSASTSRRHPLQRESATGSKCRGLPLQRRQFQHPTQQNQFPLPSHTCRFSSPWAELSKTPACRCLLSHMRPCHLTLNLLRPCVMPCLAGLVSNHQGRCQPARQGMHRSAGKKRTYC